MHRSHFWAVAALATGLLSPGAQAELRYRVQNLGLLSGHGDQSLSFGFDLNNAGAVAGYVFDPDGPDEAFVFQDGRLRALGSVGGLQASQARAINDRGQVVGVAIDPATSERRLFRWTDGRLADMSRGPGVLDRDAWDINDAGQVVGAIHGRAFVLDGGRLQYLPFGTHVSQSVALGLNAQGVVVGRAQFESTGDYQAFVWDGARPSFLPRPAGAPDAGLAAAVDINDAGAIAVNVGNDGYLYSNGSFEQLGSLGGPVTHAAALNADGWVVGTGTLDYNPRGPGRAVLFHDGVLHDLNGLLTPAAASRWTLNSAYDINDRGQITGIGTIGGRERAFLATPVPEPGAWALLLAGLAGVGWKVRRCGARGASLPEAGAGVGDQS